MAAGLATCGKIVFASSYAVFATERAYNQVKQSIAFTGLNVKIVASQGDTTVGEDGASHHMPFDIAVMRVLPNMTVVSPADASETYVVVKTLVKHDGPAYVRLPRPSAPQVFEKGYTYDRRKINFEIGKVVVLRNGQDATILATGVMVAVALEASRKLISDGIHAGVIDIPTIKPLDTVAILKFAKSTGAIVTAEEGSIIGGLGGAVAEAIVRNAPMPVEMVGLNDVFMVSGSPQELMNEYGLTADDVAKAVKRAIKRKI
jgi:transketolase